MVRWLLLPWLFVRASVYVHGQTDEIECCVWICLFVCPYWNSLSHWSQQSLKVPLLSLVGVRADPWSAGDWPQAHLLSRWQMWQRLALDLCLSPQLPRSLSDRMNLCQTFSLVLQIHHTDSNVCFLPFETPGSGRRGWHTFLQLESLQLVFCLSTVYGLL